MNDESSAGHGPAGQAAPARWWRGAHPHRPRGREVSLTPLVRVLAVVVVVLVVVGPTVRIAVEAVQGDAALPLAWLDEAKRQTDLDGEANLPATFSAVLLALVGVALLALAGVRRARGERARPVVVLAAVAGYLGLDEATELHESLALVAEHLHATLGLHNFAWLVPGVLVAAAGGVVVLRLARALPRRLRLRLMGAGAVYLFGALVMEYVTSFFLVDLPGTAELTAPQPVSYILLNAVEEGAEMLGALLALAAVLAELRLRVVDGGVAVVGVSQSVTAGAVRHSGGLGGDPSLGRTAAVDASPGGVVTVSEHRQGHLHGGEGER
ncbi:hypothetical protein SAMN06264364_10139 [Quadrisphaera granulorum]|uniref:Uncharacterized protein n=1 Tax=Quadrisphaera granulorum TaxID=317664 RepID=A0A316AE57_9ACTN|nr:hypothetical protein [Quadrisphaera granulorum]PWJ56065.1 hypothetical protein BXY45_10139 [Quadrisphaera granulorum]SZE94699.1 hypothetical protein SAMN06264364_10139 [Quadrisphaera granulorum]